MLALMAEIVVKAPPVPVKLRPTQRRPASAMQARAPPDAAGASAAGSAAVRPSSASNAGASSASTKPAFSRRPFGSTCPPDGSRFPQPSHVFEKLTPSEAADRLDGIGGTTLPGAMALQEHHERALIASEAHRIQKNEMRAARVEASRAEFSKTSAMLLPPEKRWGADRVQSALLTKFDQFTNRAEDHTRKLLWTLGTDPHFKEAGHPRGRVKVTPENFPRVCDRFGISCGDQQAAEIFAKVGLPAQGCSVSQLMSRIHGSSVNMADVVRAEGRQKHGDAYRPAQLRRPHTPKLPHDPFKVAGLCERAWARHRADSTGGVAAALSGHAAPAAPPPAPALQVQVQD